jgi:hypothetical protein
VTVPVAVEGGVHAILVDLNCEHTPPLHPVLLTVTPPVQLVIVRTLKAALLAVATRVPKAPVQEDGHVVEAPSKGYAISDSQLVDPGLYSSNTCTAPGV